MKSEKTLDDTACMDSMFTMSIHIYTSLVHFRVTSHPECTHILGSSKAQYQN